MDGNLNIVCYTGGSCGDLITAMIDPTDATINNFGTVEHVKFRQQLKKPHSFSADSEKDNYLNLVKEKYNSIPSHDLNFHIARKHKFISITVENFDVAIWAAQRFKKCHRPHVWEEMKKFCGADDISGYAQIMIDFSKMVVQHTDNIVKLEDIVTGKAIVSLQNILGYELDAGNKDFYNAWLNMQDNINR